MYNALRLVIKKINFKEVEVMIDLEKAKIFYKEYISNYNTDNPKIALKIAHIFRTAEKAKKIAINLELEKEDIQLAELIGMLHDIGRFEQLKQYNTYNDRKSINHGEYGAKILFEDRLIEKFIDDRQYDRIIYLAILNHNRDKIEDGINERELLHCKIIRDADKWDIFYVEAFESNEAIWGVKEPIFDNEVTPEIFDGYMKTGRIDYSKKKVKEDTLITYLSYFFDIYFDYTLENIQKENYIDAIRNRYTYNNVKLIEQLDMAYCKANEYIEERLKWQKNY